MARIERDANRFQIKTDVGTVTIETISDQNYLFIKTDLGSVEIRMRIQDDLSGWLESIAISPDDNVMVEGDTMVLLRKKTVNPF